MRTTLSCALTALLLFGAGCVEDFPVGNDGAGGAGTEAGGGGSSTSGGGAGLPSNLVTESKGDCLTNEGAAPLEHEIIHQTSDAEIASIADFGACDPFCGVWNAVIADEAAYQPFVDIGFPQVDFATSVVLISAGRDSTSCSLTAGQDTPKVALRGDTHPHLTISYSFAGFPTELGCGSCLGVGFSTVAVKIAIPTHPPRFCTHLTTGC